MPAFDFNSEIGIGREDDKVLDGINSFCSFECIGYSIIELSHPITDSLYECTGLV